MALMVCLNLGYLSILLYLILFDKFYTDKTARSISVTLSNIEEDVNQQLSLYEKDNEKKRKLRFVMGGMRNKYGSKAILRAAFYTPAGTAIYRAGLTGENKS